MKLQGITVRLLTLALGALGAHPEQAVRHRTPEGNYEDASNDALESFP